MRRTVAAHARPKPRVGKSKADHAPPPSVEFSLGAGLSVSLPGLPAAAPKAASDVKAPPTATTAPTTTAPALTTAAALTPVEAKASDLMGTGQGFAGAVSAAAAAPSLQPGACRAVLSQVWRRLSVLDAVSTRRFPKAYPVDAVVATWQLLARLAAAPSARRADALPSAMTVPAHPLRTEGRRVMRGRRGEGQTRRRMLALLHRRTRAMADLIPTPDAAAMILNASAAAGGATHATTAVVARRAASLLFPRSRSGEAPPEPATFTPPAALALLSAVGNMRISGHHQLRQCTHAAVAALPAAELRSVLRSGPVHRVVAVARAMALYDVSSESKAAAVGAALEARKDDLALQDCCEVLRSLRRWSEPPLEVAPAAVGRLVAELDAIVGHSAPAAPPGTTAPVPVEPHASPRHLSPLHVTAGAGLVALGQLATLDHPEWAAMYTTLGDAFAAASMATAERAAQHGTPALLHHAGVADILDFMRLALARDTAVPFTRLHDVLCGHLFSLPPGAGPGTMTLVEAFVEKSKGAARTKALKGFATALHFASAATASPVHGDAQPQRWEAAAAAAFVRWSDDLPPSGVAAGLQLLPRASTLRSGTAPAGTLAPDTDRAVTLDSAGRVVLGPAAQRRLIERFAASVASLRAEQYAPALAAACRFPAVGAWDAVTVQHVASHMLDQRVARHMLPEEAALVLRSLPFLPEGYDPLALRTAAAVAIQDADRCELAHIPEVVAALRAGACFSTSAFARYTQRLLRDAAAEDALPDLVASLSAIARASGETARRAAPGFSDLLKILRSRVLDEAHTLPPDACLAASDAFVVAGHDEKISVALAQQLASCLGPDLDAPQARALCSLIAKEVSPAAAAGLFPAAVALAIDACSVPAATLLGPLAFALRRDAAALQPQEQLLVLPALLDALSPALHYVASGIGGTGVAPPHPCSAVASSHAALLHSAYDAVRGVFLGVCDLRASLTEEEGRRLQLTTAAVDDAEDTATAEEFEETIRSVATAAPQGPADQRNTEYVTRRTVTQAVSGAACAPLLLRMATLGVMDAAVAAACAAAVERDVKAVPISTAAAVSAALLTLAPLPSVDPREEATLLEPERQQLERARAEGALCLVRPLHAQACLAAQHCGDEEIATFINAAFAAAEAAAPFVGHGGALHPTDAAAVDALVSSLAPQALRLHPSPVVRRPHPSPGMAPSSAPSVVASTAPPQPQTQGAVSSRAAASSLRRPAMLANFASRRRPGAG